MSPCLIREPIKLKDAILFSHYGRGIRLGLVRVKDKTH
jgi:hypothetical protein